MNTKLLRQKILDLAIRGKLTEQKKSDGTTKDLLAQIQDERRETKDERDAGKKDSSNVILERTSNVILERTSNVIASEAKQSKKSKPAEPKTIIPLNKDEAPFEIPENWEWVRLGDIAYIASGSTPSKDCFVDEGVPYLKMYNLRNQQIDFDYKPQFVKREIHEGKLARSRTKPYDVIMNIVGPPLGKIALIPESLPECNFNQAAVLIRAHYETRLMNQYIRFYLMQMGEINSINTKGTAGQENLSLSQTQNMRLPLPPLAEQKRIVEAIESAFAEITAIENNQELLKKHIKQGRQKILDLAIRGKLTEQNESDGTTKDLLARIQDERRETKDERDAGKKDSSNVILERTSNVIASEAKQSKKSKPAEPKTIIPLNKDEAPFEIPETWEWVKLGDVAYIASGSTPSKDCFVDEGVPYLKMYNLRNQKIDFDYKPQFVKREIHEGKLARSQAKPYDVIMNIVGPPLGKIALIPESLPECNFNQAAVLIRANYETKLMDQYIRFYLMQMGEINSINTKGTAGQENLSLTQTQNMRFPLPPLAEQQRIVAAIESAFTEFDAMEKL